MTSLDDRQVLVTGASGHVGWGIARAVAEAGGRLVLPTRSSEGAKGLSAEFGDAARVLTLDVSTAAGQSALAAALDEVPVHHAVTPVGSWWEGGPTIEEDPDDLTALLGTYAVTQLRLARTVIPRLERGGTLTIVTGAAGEHLADGTGLLTIAVRAQYAVSDVLRDELRDDPARVNEVRIAARVEREPRDGVVPAERAGAFFVALMDSDVDGEVVRMTPDDVD